MSAGAPARATELISIEHENGPQAQSQRGVFIDNGMVVFITGYHKGYKKGHQVNIVHRYVPREDPVEPEDAGSEGNGEESSDEEEDWLGGMARQSVEARFQNVDGLWDTDRVLRIMYRETESRINVRIGVATWRHAYPAIQGKLSHDPGVQEMLDDIYERPSRSAASASIVAVRARQAGHSIEMEEMIYGLLLTANPFATMSEQARFRKVSIDWHRMLRFPSSWTDHTVNPEVQHRRQVEERQAQQRRWDRNRGINIAATLAKLYGRKAKLRGRNPH
ncbi:hypothetical protein LTR49_027621 [Elasticomyces elasticus]|nr:hypothetical protein LTR49_027621 [Elasticomyces elasticus]